MEALTKIPRITAVIHEVRRLRNLYDAVESHVRGLESLEISQEMYGCFLTPTIMQKLPEEFRIAVTRNLTLGSQGYFNRVRKGVASMEKLPTCPWRYRQ